MLPKHSLRALGMIAAYAAWIAFFRLLALTFITYFLLGSSPRFQDITDVFGANEITLMAIAAVLFVAGLVLFRPLTSTSRSEVVSFQRLQRRFFPGLLGGTILGVGTIIAFVLSGNYRFQGLLLQADEGPWSLATAGLRALSITLLVYCEEFLFRQKLLSALRRDVADIPAAVLCAVLFCAVKQLQFDLGWMQTATLFLATLALGLRAEVEGDFARGAGFWAALLVLFQPLLSLPVLGSDFQGIFLVRYEPSPGIQADLFRLLTGGAGGPLSSFGLQLLLAAEAWQVYRRNRKILSRVKIRGAR